MVISETLTPYWVQKTQGKDKQNNHKFIKEHGNRKR